MKTHVHVKGKNATTFGIGSGEAVPWRRKNVGRACGKLTSLSEDGILGWRSCGALVVDGKRLWRTKAAGMKPPSKRQSTWSDTRRGGCAS